MAFAQVQGTGSELMPHGVGVKKAGDSEGGTEQGEWETVVKKGDWGFGAIDPKQLEGVTGFEWVEGLMGWKKS